MWVASRFYFMQKLHDHDVGYLHKKIEWLNEDLAKLETKIEKLKR